MENKGSKILIIEDSENILSLLKLMLDVHGWQVIGKENVDRIIETLQEEKIDLLLMDMLLSGTNGCDYCRKIKMNPATRHIPVVMMSAHPSAEIESVGAGADYFIAKPFEMNELIELLSEALSDKT